MPDKEKNSVLLVDDQPGNLLALAAALAPLGVEILRADSGREALARAEERDFSVILLDMDMPGLDGIQTVRLLRQKPAIRRTPVILLVPPDADEVDLIRGYEAGATDVIHHTATAAILRAKVRNLASISRGAADHHRAQEELAEANRSLLESQRFVKALTEATPQIIFVYDLETRSEIYVNSAVTGVLGYRPRQIEEMGSSFLDRLIHPDDMARALEHLNAMKRAKVGEWNEYEARFRHVDGSWRWLCTRSTVFARHPDGRPRQLAGSAYDITDSKRAAEDLRRLNEELEQRVLERTAALEASERRARLLSEASALLAGSLDYATTLDQTAHLAVPEFADWCAVHAVSEDGTIRSVAVAHSDPSREAFARQIVQRYPFNPDSNRGIAAVIRSGRAQLFSDMTANLGQLLARDDEHQGLLEQLSLESAICVPIPGRERVLGALSFATSRSGRIYGNADLDFARELARRAAVAIENALLYRAAQDEVAERRRAENARSEADQRLSAIFSQTLAGIAQLDLTGRFMHVNQRFCQLAGRSAEELLQLRITDITHPEDLPRNLPLFENMASGGSGFTLEKRFVRPDGSSVWVNSSVSPLSGPDGRTESAVAVLQDISDRKRAEEELHRLDRELADARDAAVEANQAKSAFLANMSHELRTPLNAVIGYAEMIQEELLEIGQEQMARDLEKVRFAGNHLLTVIGDVLDLSKIEAGRMELVPEAFSVEEVVREAVVMVAPLLERHGNGVGLTFESSPGSMIADRTRFRQILFNLLSNAAKFTERGSVNVICRKVARTDGDWIELEVRDTGVGMSPDQLSRLFQKFQQFDSSPTRRHGGTGLGLAISRLLCDLMGGTIMAESHVGSGSVFRVSLPVDTRGRTPSGLLTSPPVEAKAHS